MIAEGYVANGAKTYIASRKLDVCEEVAAELSSLGTCIPLQADLSSMDGITGLAEAMTEREEALDILVNNSGANWAVPFDEFPESGWDKVMDLNTKAVFFLTQALAPLLRAASAKNPPSRVINTASIDGMKVPTLDTFAYAASKAGTIHLTRKLAQTLSPDITVNAICPGPFESRMMHGTIERIGDQIVAENPMHRLGRPGDMAGIAIFLASEAGSYINGAHIPVDGGSATTR